MVKARQPKKAYGERIFYGAGLSVILTPETVEQARIKLNILRAQANLEPISDVTLNEHIGIYYQSSKAKFVGRLLTDNVQLIFEREKQKTAYRNSRDDRRARKRERAGDAHVKRQQELQTKIGEAIRADVSRIRGKKTVVRAGFVYVMSNPVFPGWVKIGSTTNLRDRLSTAQVHDPLGRYKYEFYLYFRAGRRGESLMHQRFDNRRGEGEWFNVEVQEAIQALKELNGS